MQIARFRHAVHAGEVAKVGEEFNDRVVFLRRVVSGNLDTTGGVCVENLVVKNGAAARAGDLLRLARGRGAEAIAKSSCKSRPAERAARCDEPGAGAFEGTLGKMWFQSRVLCDQEAVAFIVVELCCCCLCRRLWRS